MVQQGNAKQALIPPPADNFAKIVSPRETTAYRRQLELALPHVNGRDIGIWGTRERGALMKELLESMGQTCKFYISSRPKAETCNGLPLYSPEYLDVKKHYLIVTPWDQSINHILSLKGFRWLYRDFFHLNYIWHDDLVYGGCPVGRGSYGYETLTDQSLDLFVKRIGRFCSINGTARAYVRAYGHNLDWVTTSLLVSRMEYLSLSETAWQAFQSVMAKLPPEEEYRQPHLIEIGNDVWIGANVVLLDHVKIGDGAVIGSGAVVTKDVEPYAIVGGVPAKVLRYRYPREMIDAFMRIRWWDWPLEKIEENIALFYDPKRFCKTFDPLRQD